jgi:bla regulator protein BlaR1
MTGDTVPAALSMVFDRLTLCGIQAAFAIVLVLAIRAVLGKRLHGQWLYVLWLIVMLRLALPWVPQTRWSPVNLNISMRHESTARSAASPPRFAPPTAADTSPVVSKATPSVGRPSFDEQPASLPMAIASAQSAPRDRSGWSARHYVYIVWLAGIGVFSTCIGVSVLRFRHRIVRQRPVTAPLILDLLEDCKQQMGIATPVFVVVTDQTSSPALFGFVRPRLLIPPGVLEALSPEELRHVFLHELAHLKRHDVLMGWLMCALQIVHWCNPLVWIAQSRMRADRELACDALAMSALRTQDPRQYGNTIVRLLEHFSRPRYLPALTGILEQKSQLKRRVAMIADFRPQSREATMLAIGLAGVVGFLALTTAPVTAQEEAISASQPEPVSKPEAFSTDKTYVIKPGVGFELIQLGATAKQIQEVMGEPGQKDDFNRSYKLSFEKASVDFVLDKESNRVREMHFNDGFNGRLVNGIRMGSPLEQLLSRVGRPNKVVHASPEEAQRLHMGADRVLYSQKIGRKIIAYEFADEKRGVNYWFGEDKKLEQVVVYAASEPVVSRTMPHTQPASVRSAQPATRPAAEANHPRTETIIVPSTANIHGAGHRVLPAPAGGGGGTPPLCIVLSPSRANGSLTFGSIVGQVTGDHNHFRHNGPDGGRAGSGHTDISAINGLSGIKHGGANHFLLGVFLTADEPKDPAPETLDFTGSTSFSDLHPKIGQLFFIGDGLTASGTGLPQRFHLPAGATRLFLGFADAWAAEGLPGWYDDNAGALRVTVELLPDEEYISPPSTAPAVTAPVLEHSPTGASHEWWTSPSQCCMIPS